MKYIFLIIFAFSITCNIKAQVYTDTLKENSLGYLVSKGMKYNSKLEYIDIQRRIELIKKEQVNKQPMPMLEAMVNYIPLDFMAKPEYDISYSQRLMLPSKISALEGTSGVNAKRQDILRRQLQIELKRQIYADYFNIYYFQRLIDFNLEYQDIMKNLVKNIETAYVSGMGTQTQIIKMYSEIQTMEFENIELNASRQRYINDLRVLTNLDIQNNFRTQDSIMNVPQYAILDSNKLINELVNNNPEFKLIDNMIESARIEKNIAMADKTPDITLKGGYMYMAKEPMSYLVFSVGVDLPFMPWNVKRIDAMVEEKTVMELQANSMRTSSLQYMKNEMQGMLIMINSMKERITYLKDVLIPTTDQIFNSSIVSYSAGSGDFMTMLDSYRNMREHNQILIKEETDLLKQYSELEFLLGK